MKRTICHFISIVIFALISNVASAQDVVAVCGNEPVKLRAGNYHYGTIQWERSVDNVYWEIIPEAKDTVYEFIPEEDMYYRAVATFSDCPQEYSQTAFVQMPPEANAGLDRIVVGNAVYLQPNVITGSQGLWQIIEGKGNCTVSDIRDPYALLEGKFGTFKLEWTLSNTCGISKDTVEVEFIQNKYAESIVIVDDTDSILSTTSELEEGTYIISFSEPVPSVSAETYLIGITMEEGFLRKVDSFTQEGNTFFCQTSQATLEDIIEEGGFNFEQVFTIDEALFTEKNGITYAGDYARLDHKPTRKELTSDPKYKEGNYFYIVQEDEVFLHPGVELKSSPDKGPSIGLSFNNVIFHSNSLNIKLGGYYRFNPNFVAQMKISWFKLKYFKMGLSNATIERNIHLTTNAIGSVNMSNKNFTLFSINKNIIFLIAGVPIWIHSNFKIEGKVNANTSGGINIEQGITEKFTYNAYIEYKKKWKYVFNEKRQSQPYVNYTSKNNLFQSVEIGPTLTFKLFKIVGPYVGVRMKEDFGLRFRSDDWQTNMGVGGSLFVGIKAKLLGKTLFDKSKTWSSGFYSYQFPNNLQIAGGDNQEYTPGNALAHKIKVKVNSDKAMPLPGAVVRFIPKNGGSVANSMVIADSKGYAETIWTPGGGQSSKLEAKVYNGYGNDIKNSPLIFNAYSTLSEINCAQSSLSMTVERSGSFLNPRVFMGKPPYAYSTDGLHFSSQMPSLPSNPGTNNAFFIKDNSQCRVEGNFNIPAVDCKLSNLQLAVNVLGTTIEASGTGGVPPYLYSLGSSTSGFGPDSIFNNLPEETHVVYIKDNHGCIKSEEAEVTGDKPPIIADFSADKTSIKTGESVHFENLSNNAASWEWIFGDGQTSAEEDPVHTYTTAGTFTVSLAVKNMYGSDTKTIQNYIVVIPETGSRRQPCPNTPMVTDSDGNVYDAILIGHQCWMAENLKTTTYNDGSPIDYPGGNDMAWENNATGAYTWYLNEPGNKNTYGALYNWHAVNNSHGLCPAGWHVPSDAEWTQMTNYLINNHPDITIENIHNKLKSCRQINSPLGGNCNTNEHPRWNSSDNSYGTDDFGFSGLPGGIRSSDGSYYMLGERGKWWSSTEGQYVVTTNQQADADHDPSSTSSFGLLATAWNRVLSIYDIDMLRSTEQKASGLSIRCVRSEGEEVILPSIVTSPVTDITDTSASGGGQVDFDGGAFVSARGVCWSTSQNPTIGNNKTSDGTGTGSFFSVITGLTPGSTYYLRAYASNSAGTVYGEQVVFQTTSGAPAVTTNSITGITSTTATGGGSVTSDGGSAVSTRGVCWNTSQNPTLENNLGMTSNGSGTGAFSSDITGLTPNTTYYVRAYATNSVGTAYGNQVQFTTGANLPTVTTHSITNITQTTATGGGDVTSDGGAAVTARGVCWGTIQNPTLDNNRGMTIDGTGTGAFTSNLSNLTPGRTYYVRAYATNSMGTAYGNQVQFTAGANLPDVTTNEITSITKYTATGGGYVTADGGATVTERGICWSTSQNPSIESNMGMTSNGSGRGGFTSYLTGLSHGTIYYVRAYATNSAGTAYGNQVTFTTEPDIPVVTTAGITNITRYTATGGGNVSSDGGATVTARGICWSTSQNPTTQSNLGMTTNGTGTGAFTSNIAGLSPAKVYYVRAYATNSAGTAYGNQVQFITDPDPPTVTTNNITNITANTASGGGNVTSDGGAAVTMRGICWSTSQFPTTQVNQGLTINGSGTGTFNSSLTGLAPGTTYYVRAYATNSAGTSYGNQLQFATNPSSIANPCPGMPTISDIDGNVYHTILIGSKCWTVENLKTTRYKNGVAIAYPGTNNTNWMNNTTGAYAWYNNDASNKDKYGALYNWYAVTNTNRLCPSGWYPGLNYEWEYLKTYLINNYADISAANLGKKLKSCRQVNSPLGGGCSTSVHPRWNTAGAYGTDDLGFSGLPGGLRYPAGTYSNIGVSTEWWTESQVNSERAYTHGLGKDLDVVTTGSFGKSYGLSVRCVIDLEPPMK